MKILIAVGETGRAPIANEMVRVPAESDCSHKNQPCMCRARWVSTLPGAGRWQLAKVVETPACFTLAAEHDTPEVRRMLAIAADLPAGTVLRITWRPETIANGVSSSTLPSAREVHALAYHPLVIGPN